jgi:hypothetical protein
MLSIYFPALGKKSGLHMNKEHMGTAGSADLQGSAGFCSCPAQLNPCLGLEYLGELRQRPLSSVLVVVAIITMAGSAKLKR